jgi:TPR repeat protein
MQAVSLYTKATEQGHTGVQFSLGNFYKNGLGVAKNYKKPVCWYKKAVDTWCTKVFRKVIRR